MGKLTKKKILYAIILIGIFVFGMLFQYFLLNSKAAAKLEHLNDEIKIAKENNKQLEKEIVNLHKEIEKYNDEELTDSNNEDSNITSSNQINTTDSTNTPEEQTNTSDDQSNQEQAINLVKEYIGYSSESNIHLDVQGSVPGSDDLSIQVYEIIVDEEESQHTATLGWYGVNVKTGKVYEVNND